MKKVKLGDLLFNRGFVQSVDDAKRIIMANQVLVNDIPITKPGTLCDPKSRIRLKKKKNFVSRGGDKLSGFIKEFSIDVSNKCCIDVGISTGGFSDVLFRNNALHILGIDVGYGIIDFQLRKNQKLSLLERTNAREVTKKEIHNCLKPHHIVCADISLIVMDVSFISVFKIIPNLLSIFNKTTEYIILIKPQFESEKHHVEAGGIISNQAHIKNILTHVEAQFSDLDLNILHTAPSKIKGTKGNQEYFYHVQLNNAST